MEVKQMLAGSKRVVRSDRKSTNKTKATNRLPLQDQTNIIIKRSDLNYAMVGGKLKTLTETNAGDKRNAVLQDIKRRSTFVLLDKSIESIISTVINTDVLDKSKEKHLQVGGKLKSGVSETSNEAIVNIAKLDAKEVSTRKSRSVTRCINAEDAKDIDKSAVKELSNALTNVFKGRKKMQNIAEHAEYKPDKNEEKDPKNSRRSKRNSKTRKPPEKSYDTLKNNRKNLNNEKTKIISKNVGGIKKVRIQESCMTIEKQGENGIGNAVEKNRRILRGNKKLSYAELSGTKSRETVEVNDDGKTHPIYYQTRVCPENCELDDVYEFDSDSGEVRKSRRKRDSVVYDKGMDSIVEKLEKKFKKTRKPSKAKVEKKQIPPKNRSKTIPDTKNLKKRIPDNFEIQDNIIDVDKNSDSKQIPPNTSPKVILDTKNSQKNYSKEIQNATDFRKRILNNLKTQTDISQHSNFEQILASKSPKEVHNIKEFQKNLKQIPTANKNYSKQIQNVTNSRKGIPDNVKIQDDVNKVHKNSNSKQISTSSKYYLKQITKTTNSRKQIPDNIIIPDETIEVDKTSNSKQTLPNNSSEDFLIIKNRQKNLIEIPNSINPSNLKEDNVKNSSSNQLINSWKRIPNHFDNLRQDKSKVNLPPNSGLPTKIIPYDINNCIPHCRHVINHDNYEESGDFPPCQARDKNNDEELGDIPHCHAPDFDRYFHDDEVLEDIADCQAVTSKMFDFDEPIANSTMLNTTRQDVEASPWRSNLNVRRNPHFLHFKESFLPNYNQEMVFESSLVEKSLRNTVGPTKSHKQASILDYIDGKEHEVRIANSTLFDIDQFSPIKENISTKKQQASESPKKILLASPKKLSRSQNVDKENLFVNNQKRNVDRVKRNILGAIVDNEQYDERDSPGISDCFGFDASMSELVDERVDKPTRADSFVGIQRRKNRIFDDLDSMDDVAVDENTQHCATNEDIGGLFKDCEPDRTLEHSAIRQYVVPKKRQRRCRSPSPYTDDDDQEHHHRKKRNKRTKKEEAEAEKWFAAFNSMCEEVEKFPLEIQ